MSAFISLRFEPRDDPGFASDATTILAPLVDAATEGPALDTTEATVREHLEEAFPGSSLRVRWRPAGRTGARELQITAYRDGTAAG